MSSKPLKAPIAGVILLLAGPAGAATESPAERHIVVPQLAAAPRIDGAIGADEWAGAARLSAFTQLEPDEGRPASEGTSVLIGREGDTLYIAFDARDREPEKIHATRTPRDRIPDTDDLVVVYLDPFHTGTRCYTFGFNPLGVQRDGIWSRQNDFTWDTVLSSAGVVHGDGYVVEAAIPLTSLLGGARAQTAWDVNFGRRISRKGEESWWAPLRRDRVTDILGDFGSLDGMHEVASVSRVELIPTAVGRLAADGGAASAADGTVGLTAFVPVPRVGRIEATYRPDFSEVESDTGQITFNERYALFYPEKRPFFLEGQDQFLTPSTAVDSDPLRLVHTRTLARPRYGVRFLTSPGQTFVGGLVTAEDALDGTADGHSAVVRALRRWSGSQAGVIATRRTRDGHANTVVGADAQIALPASSTLTLQVARSRDDDAGDAARTSGLAGYADFSRQDSRSLEQVVFRVIPRDFSTEVGFIPRGDLRQVVEHGGVYFRPHAGPLLYVLPMIQHVLSFDEAGRFADNEYLPHVEVQFTRQTQLFFGYRAHEEAFRDRRYRAARFEPRITTAPTRWVAFSLKGRVGSRLRYDESAGADRSFVGAFREVEASSALNLGRNLTATLYAIAQSYGAGTGMPAANVRLARTQVAYQFDNFTYVRTIVQWDTENHDREFSLLAARVLNYGTQVDAGLEYRAADGLIAAQSAPTARHWAAFLRVSYLLRR